MVPSIYVNIGYFSACNISYGQVKCERNFPIGPKHVAILQSDPFSEVHRTILFPGKKFGKKQNEKQRQNIMFWERRSDSRKISVLSPSCDIQYSNWERRIRNWMLIQTSLCSCRMSPMWFYFIKDLSSCTSQLLSINNLNYVDWIHVVKPFKKPVFSSSFPLKSILTNRVFRLLP